MDRERFDALTRMFVAKRSRRGALVAVVGAALFQGGAHALAKPGKAKGKGHGKGHGAGHDTGAGQGHDNDGTCDPAACARLPVPEGAKPEFCCKGGFCSCGGKCCPGTDCFQSGLPDEPINVFCCTGPKLVVCCEKDDCTRDPEATCCAGSCDACGNPGPSGIAGSYRRFR
jgi:hypothetical protein